MIHTSDWHLGRTLGRIERLPDQMRRVEEIVAHVVREQVDVLIVAGDVFDELNVRPLAPIVRQLGTVLAPAFAIGTQVVFLAGNHDRDHVFSLADQFGLLAGGHGRARFVHRPSLVSLQTSAGRLHLVLLPFPTAARFELPHGNWPSADAEHRALGAAVRKQLRDLAAVAQAAAGEEPVILVGHFLLQGLPPGFCANEREEMKLQEGALPDFAYAALGHIHQPQSLRSGRVRYSGGIERLDAGEAFDEREVVLVQLQDGETRTSTLPLQATPFAKVRASTTGDLDAAHAAMASPQTTLVALELRVHRGESPGLLQAHARKLFARIYGVEIASADEYIAPPAADFIRTDPRETVMAYLAQKLAGDPDAEAVIKLAYEELNPEEPPP